MTAVITWLLTSKLGRAVGGIALLVALFFGFKAWLAWHDASVARGATSQMVTKFERDALASQIATERRLRLDAEQASTEAAKRADATLRAKAMADAEVDRLKADAAQNGKLSRPNEEDMLWLEQH